MCKNPKPVDLASDFYVYLSQWDGLIPSFGIQVPGWKRQTVEFNLNKPGRKTIGVRHNNA